MDFFLYGDGSADSLTLEISEFSRNISRNKGVLGWKSFLEIEASARGNSCLSQAARGNNSNAQNGVGQSALIRSSCQLVASNKARLFGQFLYPFRPIADFGIES